MKRFAYKLVHQYALFASVLTFILTLSMGLYASFITEQSTQSLEKERARQMAEIQAGKIQHVVDSLLFTGQTAKILLTEGGGEINNFEQCMKDIMGEQALRNIALAPQGIVSEIYPLKGNESAVGHNLLTDPARMTEANTARESRSLTLAGPFNLRQGGVGAVGWLPIYFNNENGEEYFWGFICVTLAFPQALEHAQMHKLEEQGYSYELWKLSPGSGEKLSIMQSQNKLSDDSQSVPVSLPNTQWYLNIAPSGGWFNTSLFLIGLVLSLILATLATLLSRNVMALVRSKNDLSDSLLQQSANYQKMNHLNEELRIFRHDVKNHYLSLFSLLENGDLDGAKGYLSNMADMIVTGSEIINTENYVFDALLAKKTAKAREKQIQVESEIFIGKQLKIENKDWSILFGNALDNAIEACGKLPEEKRRIHIFVRYKGNILQTKITNSMMPVSAGGDSFLKTTKEDKKNHGLGLKQMQAVIQKYRGVIETSRDEDTFILFFLLFDV